MRPRFLTVASAALVAGIAPAGARAEGPPFRVAPAPAWVEPAEAEVDAVPPPGASRDGVYELLSEREVRVSRAGVERYVHIARKIVTAAGVEAAAELRFDVDPPHERLVLHHIRILRGGHAEDALRPQEIHVIQQESDLSQRMYNGVLTAVAFLHDVRAGDVLDYAFSVNGQNPVLGERFSETFSLTRLAPVRRLRVRILTPLDRPLTLTPRATDQQPEERTDAGGHSYRWERRDVPALRLEDEIPRWFNPYPRLDATEYRSFGEVAAWAVPLFAVPTRPGRAVDEQVERLRRAAPDEPGRVLAALRFVQNEVRYLGIELGPHSHEPHPPATVLERRFGDCKDKTLLLVTLLRGLGIEAHAALVNPDLGRALDEHAPTPLAFNHVIVLARSGGRDHWLDPTISAQRGGLETLPVPAYERALVVAPGTTGLTTMPEAALAAPSVEEVEEIDAHDYAAPALLRVTTTYRGAAADAMRSSLAATDRAEVARGYLNYYAHEEPSIEEAAAPVLTDDEATATFTVTESYRIPDFWREPTKTFSVGIIARALTSPAVALRTMPLRVQHPTSLMHETTLILPATDMIDTAVTELADESMSLRCSTSGIEHVAHIRCAFKTLRDFVPASGTAEHLRLVGKMREALGYSFTRSQPAVAAAASEDDWKIWLGIGALTVMGLGLYVGIPYARRLPRILKKRAFRRRQAIASGEAPATAIPVPSIEELGRRALKSRCACGTRLPGGDELSTGQVRLGERTITSARLTCSACGQARSLFFEVQG